MVKLVTDSTSYIPKELQEKYDIKIISLNIILNGKSYREVDLDNVKFYEEMEKSPEIPTSSQPSIEELLDLFKDIISKGNELVAVFLSSKMSGTYSSAHLVKEMVLEEYPDAKIEIIDSKTNCMEMGFQVLQGAKAAQEGKDIEEVKNIINSVQSRGKFLFVPDTLKYLKKGGRIGGAAALVGSILQIKPILTVVDGVTTVFEKVRTKKKAINVIENKVVKDMEDNGMGEVIVHHINCQEEGLEVANSISKRLNVPVAIQTIGPIIGVHVGPGCVGISYYTKN